MRQNLMLAVRPYEALVEFVNEKNITAATWRAVLDRLASWRSSSALRDSGGERAFRLPQAGRYFGHRVPEVFQGQQIRGPEPLLKIQRKLREDFARLTDPERDPIPPSLLRGFPEAIRAHPPKQVEWLLDKINSLSGAYVSSPIASYSGTTNSAPPDGPGMQVILSAATRFPRVLPTERVFFVPAFQDLRHWLYFVLAQLWVDGLLPRLGRCKTCGNSFSPKPRKRPFSVRSSAGRMQRPPSGGSGIANGSKRGKRHV